MDRTLIILDIFAKRAFTREGKIQSNLPQLKYRASKLTGQGRALSRLGGGIGTRGPGEKKLEMDRRLIRTRISRLKAELRDVVKHREVQRKTTPEESPASGLYRWIYQCRKVNTIKPFYQCRSLWRRSVVCNSWSNDKEFRSKRRADNSYDGYSRFYPQTSTSSGRSI